MAKRDLQQLQLIRERMTASGIPEKEVDDLIAPLEDELQRRVCGLVWEHTTTSIPDMEGKIPALIPVTGKNIVNDLSGDNHILIEGENLLALMAMQYTHIDENGKGMIDVIYIDPPYNTGSVSFAYNDKFEKSEWLSMMDIRLKLARNLLKDDGVIFISIDDSYQAELKMLCDDIFAPQNFITQFVWEKTHHTGKQSKNVCSNADYVITYAKNKYDSLEIRRLLIDHVLSEFEDAPLYNGSNNRKQLCFPAGTVFTKQAFDLTASTNASYKLMTPLKTTLAQDQLEVNGDIYKFSNIHNTTIEFQARWSQDEINRQIALGTRFIIKSDGCAIRTVYSDAKAETPIAPWQIIKTGKTGTKFGNGKIVGTNEEGSIAVKRLVPNGDFSYPKPVTLIEYLISLIKKQNITILDFFAGSGTTGQAVLDLNKEDGGHRQFILCTNNELGKDALKMAKKNGYAASSEEYEDLGVCHAVTYPRMQNIFPDYPGNNLYYYRIDQSITESTIDDVTIANMASQAVFYIAMKENVFNAERREDYYLLHNAKTEIAVITDPDMDMFDIEDDIVPTAFTQERRKVYCSVYEPCNRNGIEYIPYPKEVLDVLKAAKKYIRREVV